MKNIISKINALYENFLLEKNISNAIISQLKKISQINIILDEIKLIDIAPIPYIENITDIFIQKKIINKIIDRFNTNMFCLKHCDSLKQITGFDNFSKNDFYAMSETCIKNVYYIIAIKNHENPDYPYKKIHSDLIYFSFEYFQNIIDGTGFFCIIYKNKFDDIQKQLEEERYIDIRKLNKKTG